MKRILTKALLAAACVLPVAGCHITNVAPPPPLVSQVNDFDGQTYRALIALQASLSSLQADIKAHEELAGLKSAVDATGAQYNLAVTAWKTYHAAATAANQQAAAVALANAQNSVNALSKEVTK